MPKKLKPMLIIFLIAASCVEAADLVPSGNQSLGLPPAQALQSNQGKVIALGRALFFETRLSVDGKISCSSCHQPAKAFTDDRCTSQGTNGRTSTRNTPSLLNVSLNKVLFWDGRGSALAKHSMDALFNPVEHGLEDFEQVRQTISSSASLEKLFFSAFGKSSKTAEPSDVEQAIAAYLETLRSGGSPFDFYYYGKKMDAMPASAVRGLELFRGRGGCSTCHTIEEKWALFSDHGFHSLGIGRERFERQLPALVSQLQSVDPDKLGHSILTQPDIAALGRFVVSRKPQDVGKFRTPSLRNVALTAPYMHDGSVATLEEAIDLELYYRGLSGRPITLSTDEKQDLVEFLRALTSYKP